MDGVARDAVVDEGLGQHGPQVEGRETVAQSGLGREEDERVVLRRAVAPPLEHVHGVEPAELVAGALDDDGVGRRQRGHERRVGPVRLGGRVVLAEHVHRPHDPRGGRPVGPGERAAHVEAAAVEGHARGARRVPRDAHALRGLLEAHGRQRRRAVPAARQERAELARALERRRRARAVAHVDEGRPVERARVDGRPVEREHRAVDGPQAAPRRLALRLERLGRRRLVPFESGCRREERDEAAQATRHCLLHVCGVFELLHTQMMRLQCV